MKIFKKRIQISLITVIFIAALLSIGLVAYYYTDGPATSKITMLLGGLLAGLIVASCQLFLGWYEFKEISKFSGMKITDVLPNRDDRVRYYDLIKNSKKEIRIMGVTASRFKEHFADSKSTRPDSKILLTQMTNGVSVKILLPKAEYLETEEQKRNEENARQAFDEIKKTYPNIFDLKRFDHEPAHSIFIVDDICIVGPVFPSVSSKDTPAIILEKSSPFASEYLKYFDEEWSKAQ